jgi:hypothetical protein
LTKHSDSGSLETHISGTCLQFRTGRHHEAPDVAGDEVIENINWGANEESNERCGTDQEGNREGVMGCLSVCEQIDRLRDAAQQQGADFEDATAARELQGAATTWLGTSGKPAARELQGAATRHVGICRGMMRGMLRGIPCKQRQGFLSQDEGSTSQNDGKSIAQL